MGVRDRAVITLAANILLVGPSIEAEVHNRFFVEASYLFSAFNYKFTEAGVTSEFDRSDLDLAAR